MYLLRTLDRTPCIPSSHTTARPFLSFLHPATVQPSTRRSFRLTPVISPPRVSLSSAHMDTFFIQALARAGSCPEHARQVFTASSSFPASSVHHKTRRKTTHHGQREFHLKAARKGPLKRVKQFAKSELAALVDYYGIELARGPEEDVVDYGALQWNIGNDHVPWPVQDPLHTEHIRAIEELLKNEESSHEELFALYRKLPAPGVVYLSWKTIHDLLHHLSIVERPSQSLMQNFLSILDDMKSGHIHILRSEWTTAIYFAGRFMGTVGADQVETALYIWSDMEQRAGVRGGVVTLNVLFDIAVKAGKYSLAETFLKELRSRKLELHRHFRVSLLYYYGVLQDGTAVRKAYLDLVEAGEIVDTVVMNAVIASLFRAGEPAAAEHVFERMKRLHKTRTHAAPVSQNWRQRRSRGLEFTLEGKKQHDAPEWQKALQDTANIEPDSRTYGLLIRHHAGVAGNLDRVTELLREMKQNSVPVDGIIFIAIIYGFASFGGVRYSSWTKDRLEEVWQQYLRSVKEGVQNTYFSPLAVIAALKAFKKCTDDDRVLEAWEEVRKVWNPTPEETDKVLRRLRTLVPEHPFFRGNM